MLGSNNLNALTKQLVAVRAKLDKLSKEKKVLSEQEEKLEGDILAWLIANKLDGATTVSGRVSIHKQYFAVTDSWEKLYAYIKKTGSFDLLHKRVSLHAVEEREEAKKPVPGVHLDHKNAVHFEGKK